MGNSCFGPESQVDHIDYFCPETPFQVISNTDKDSTDFLDFDPQQSAAVIYGINKQLKSPPSSLGGNAILNDVQRLRKCFSDVGIVPADKINSYIADANPDQCTIAGMKESLYEQAAKVGPDGLFIFYFAGHGVRFTDVDRENRRFIYQWTLVPMDFDRNNSDTFLTGSRLSQWFAEANCKAKNILCVFDCCKASAVADDLTGVPRLNPGEQASPASCTSNIWVFAACKTHESATTLGVMQHSTFAFFFTHAIHQEISQPFISQNARFPMVAVLKECKECCEAISSLLWSYDLGQGLYPKRMTPQVRRRIETDAPIPDFVARHFKQKVAGQTKKKPHEQCHIWLQAQGKISLRKLIERKLLKDEIMDAVVGSMMYSMAAIQLQYAPESVCNPNVVLLAFCAVAELISDTCREPENGAALLELDKRHLQIGVGYYILEVKKKQEEAMGMLSDLKERLSLEP